MSEIDLILQNVLTALLVEAGTFYPNPAFGTNFSDGGGLEDYALAMERAVSNIDGVEFIACEGSGDEIVFNLTVLSGGNLQSAEISAKIL